MGAKARVDLGGPGPDTSRPDRLIVSHVKPPMLSFWADPSQDPPHAFVYRGTLHAFQGLRWEKQSLSRRFCARWRRGTTSPFPRSTQKAFDPVSRFASAGAALRKMQKAGLAAGARRAPRQTLQAVTAG
jgi:hypothetical protein